MAKDMGMIAFGMVQQLKKKVTVLEATQALRDREFDLWNSVLSKLNDQVEEIKKQVRDKDTQPAEESKGSV